MYTVPMALLCVCPPLSLPFSAFTLPSLFSFHELLESSPYFVRIQIRPRLFHGHGLTSCRSASPYLLSLPANQIVCLWASSNTKDAVTCLAFPPWFRGDFPRFCVPCCRVFRTALDTVGSTEK